MEKGDEAQPNEPALVAHGRISQEGRATVTVSSISYTDPLRIGQKRWRVYVSKRKQDVSMCAVKQVRRELRRQAGGQAGRRGWMDGRRSHLTCVKNRSLQG